MAIAFAIAFSTVYIYIIIIHLYRYTGSKHVPHPLNSSHRTDVHPFWGVRYHLGTFHGRNPHRGVDYRRGVSCRPKNVVLTWGLTQNWYSCRGKEVVFIGIQLLRGVGINSLFERLHLFDELFKFTKNFVS